MHAFAAAGATFLLAVLWFDLMFDIQIRGQTGETIPAEILSSIGAYYRRVTTDAKPMGSMVALVMLLTLGALIAEAVMREAPVWLEAASILFAASAISLPAWRTVRNAVRLGAGSGTPSERTQLARAILRDHVFCLIAMAVVAVLQLSAR